MSNNLRLPSSKLILFVALSVLLFFAFWLRWQYITQVNLFVDEFITLWASQNILEKGVPLMPSGVFYTRGFLSTYAIAAIAQVAGLTPMVGRLSSVIFGLASILAIYYIGHREWNPHVGWLAALGAVLLPEAIIASGRARFYAQLMFFVLLTIWAAYVAIREEQETGPQPFRKHLLFGCCFALAVFSQEETILLYPSLVISMFLWRGWRYFLRPGVLMGQVICVAAMGVRYGIEQLGQPGYFASIQVHKNPYITINTNIIDRCIKYSDLFISWMRTPWTLFALLAVSVALISLWKARFRFTDFSRYQQATLFFAIQFFSVLFLLLSVVGWEAERYVWLIQFCWLLAGAAGAVWLSHLLIQSESRRWLATGLLSVLIVGSMLPKTLATLNSAGTGYYDAFEYVATHRQENDLTMTPQPPACAFVLGGTCDYYARQNGHESYVVPKDGVLVDRWSGSELLESTQELETLLRKGSTVWFVTDMDRLVRRYNSEFVRLVTEQFDEAFKAADDTKVLLAKGWRQPPEIVAQTSYDPPISVAPLNLTGWERSALLPGAPFSMVLFWQPTEFVDEVLNTSLQLVASDGTRLTQADGPPTRGIVVPFNRADIPLPDFKTLTIPNELPPGRYRLETIAYKLDPYTPLSDPIVVEWLRVGPPPVAPTQTLDTAWQNGLTLVGYDDGLAALSPNERLTMRLVWITTQPLSTDYTMFLHLIGPDGQIVAQRDQPPENGFYPTSGWAVDDLVEEQYVLQLPNNLAKGNYKLLVGLYNPKDGQRLQLMDGSDALDLTQWIVD